LTFIPWMLRPHDLPVEESACMAVGEDKAISGDPLGILGIILHHLGVQEIGQGRQAHGCTAKAIMQ